MKYYYDVVTGIVHQYEHRNCHECRLGAYKNTSHIISYIVNTEHKVLPEYISIAYGLFETSTIIKTHLGSNSVILIGSK